MTELCITSWNVNGVNKLKRFFERPRSTVQKPDVLCLQETWVTHEMGQLSVHDYVAFHEAALPSAGRGVGGLTTMFRIESFADGRLSKLLSPVWWALIVRCARSDSTGLIVVNVYAARHTDGVTAEDFDLFFETIEELRATYGGDDLVVIGDLNVDRFCRPDPTSREERMILAWLQRMEANDFVVYPDKPTVTYLDASTTLDYAVIPPSLRSNPVTWQVEETLNCQHLPLSIRIIFQSRALDQGKLIVRQPNLSFPTPAVAATRELMSTLPLCHASNLPPDLLYEKITRCFLTGGVERKGMQVSRGSSWWQYVPTELQVRLKELESDAQFLAREWSQGRLLFTTSEVFQFRRELNHVSKLCSQAAESAILHELRSQFPNHTLCWKVLRKLRCPSPTVAIDLGTLHQHFQAIFHRRDRPLFIVEDPHAGWGTTRPHDQKFDELFTDEELMVALRDLNGQAGTGPQRIPSQAIKDVFQYEDARPALLLLVNMCFQLGVIPSAWGMAELFVLFKGKGLPTLADNYRAIALSDDFRRVYERLVQSRLSRWSYETNATGNMQFGFKRGTGTLEAIFCLRTFMLHATRVLRVPGFAVFIDLRKAFPSMSRPMIVETFRRIGVPAGVTRAIASLLSGSTQRLKINGKLTEPFFVTSGTPEGSINSPEVFAMVYKTVLEELDIHELPHDLSLVVPGRVYYIIFADDLTFFTLSVGMLSPKVSSFRAACEPVDMAMNANKSKWMAFLPENADGLTVQIEDWQVIVDGEQLENVDTFTYLGFKLDCHLRDTAHAAMINERFLKAARATGKLMKDMKCVSLVSLKKFFVSMVFSQLYGIVFVPAELIDFEKGVGIFVKTSLGLPDSFPHVVAVALLGARNVACFQMAQWVKMLARWEGSPQNPVFDSLVSDRTLLFPRGCGLNAALGEAMVNLGLSRTLDYRTHAAHILSTLAARVDSEQRGRLLSTEGRAFWTELGPGGSLPAAMKIPMSKVSFEASRILLLLFADALCWSALKKPTRKCPYCSSKFTTEHFFCCPRFFVQEAGWRTLVGLCQNESWEDLIDFVFLVLRKWVEDTHFVRPNFRLHVLEYENICRDTVHVAFRWNVC